VEAAVGPLVQAVVAERGLAAERRLGPADLALRRLPARYLPPDALPDPAQLVGARVAIPLPAGSFVTAAVLEAAEETGERGAGLRAGERAVTVRAAGALDGAQPGARVDVVVSGQPGAGSGGRTYVALEDVELLALDGPLATLRVTARQAVYLTAAANFAQEIRLLVRPPGDRRRIGPVTVGAGGF
jgi:pilus assembly protein CpaB